MQGFFEVKNSIVWNQPANPGNLRIQSYVEGKTTLDMLQTSAPTSQVPFDTFLRPLAGLALHHRKLSKACRVSFCFHFVALQVSNERPAWVQHATHRPRNCLQVRKAFAEVAAKLIQDGHLDREADASADNVAALERALKAKPKPLVLCQAFKLCLIHAMHPFRNQCFVLMAFNADFKALAFCSGPSQSLPAALQIAACRSTSTSIKLFPKLQSTEGLQKFSAA